ncbi:MULTISPECIES: ribbon-helix-helix protein, CopG family [unclassified Desulfovibrio]|uniref:CopG family ribbon-helix-helix protein n=1 Tax=unclassified Desulfovibrio TaxID=2593640 RepID=UPI0013EA2D69|nr:MULTISPECIES: ribbon-helix-helix protein, CopG family [unclassified Desulfovibrio]
MAQTQISLDTAILDQLDATAASLSLSREEALREAIVNYCAYEGWFRAKVEEGERDYRAGRYVSQEEATRLAEERRKKLLAMAEQQ